MQYLPQFLELGFGQPQPYKMTDEKIQDHTISLDVWVHLQRAQMRPMCGALSAPPTLHDA